MVRDVRNAIAPAQTATLHTARPAMASSTSASNFMMCPALPSTIVPLSCPTGAGRARPPAARLRHGLAALVVGALLSGLVVPGAVGAQTPLRDLTAQTLAVAEPYFQAYIARQWDTLEPLVADGMVFSDPTATTVWNTPRHAGKADVMKAFREGYAQITDMQFKPMRRFASGHHAVFEGELDWSLRLQDGRIVRSNAPFVVILEARAGRVTSHTDLLDYRAFVDALRTTR